MNRFRLRNKVVIACRGLSVGLFKKPVKQLIAKAKKQKAEIVNLFVELAAVA